MSTTGTIVPHNVWILLGVRNSCVLAWVSRTRRAAHLIRGIRDDSLGMACRCVALLQSPLVEQCFAETGRKRIAQLYAMDLEQTIIIRVAYLRVKELFSGCSVEQLSSRCFHFYLMRAYKGISSGRTHFGHPLCPFWSRFCPFCAPVHLGHIWSARAIFTYFSLFHQIWLCCKQNN
jgi:hypothetical protein